MSNFGVTKFVESLYALRQLPKGWLMACQGIWWEKSSSDWSTDLVLGYITCIPSCWIYAWTSFFKDFGIMI
ncbi:hypothetical protein Dsin_018110 [Dipteronia sinensis]|uniref:Uncharacterized protein n=1 Tax=Dipteronia sinensis TaxID=43782 RepID=A0AAE0AGK0_9ROSI|nr:hypothetical protein Dsin_018110 [Dipteronia sinensis]